jgi:predicted ATPase
VSTKQSTMTNSVGPGSNGRRLMKRHIFLDNFRGFSDTYVPISDVNFLVGQNSTGKTSLLLLLKLLSSPRLLMGRDLGGEDVELRHFNDIVSAHAEDRSYFRVGSIEERRIEGKAAVIGSLFTYREHEGLPQLETLTYTLDKDEVHVQFKGEDVRYKIRARSQASGADSAPGIIARWIGEHSQDAHGWQPLPLPKGFPTAEVPVAVLLGWAPEARKSGLILAPYREPAPGPFVWVAPIRTKPRRTYDEPSATFSSEGSHTPYVIRRMLSSSAEAKKFFEFIEKVGRASGLFQSIQIKRFGDDVAGPFEVDAILDSKALNLNMVGYGVSQSLPILVELLDRPVGSWFAIQQPEVHLHPLAQAALGDVFFEMAVTDKKRFLIETHSDFTIDRFRMNYRGKKRANPPDSQILFFERHDSRNSVTAIPIGPRGELPSDQPAGYRQFFVKEEMRLLGL